jgi:N-glycosylase/DNA lyase
MKTGFRAPYLYDAAQKLATGVISVETLKGLNENETRDELISIKGVGEKVANCVMLFSLGFREAFPVDVWIKRIMESVYFNGEDTPKDQIQLFAKVLQNLCHKNNFP